MGVAFLVDDKRKLAELSLYDAENHVLNEIRNNNSALEKNYEIVQSSPEYEDELLAKIEEKDMMEHFYQAIEHLPEQKRQVCLYKLKGNLSNQEIADKMSISVPTVKTHYAQAIKILRTHFERLFLFLLYFELILLIVWRVN